MAMTMKELINALHTHLEAYFPVDWRPIDVSVFTSPSRIGGTDCRIRPSCFPNAHSVIYPIIDLDSIIAQNTNEYEALRSIVEICLMQTQEAPGGFWSIFNNYEEARDHIYSRVYSRDVRPDLEKYYVSDAIGSTDLYTIYVLDISEILQDRTGSTRTGDVTPKADRTGYSVNISRRMTELWGVGHADIREAAEKNEERDGLDVLPIFDMISEILAENGQSIPITDDGQLPMLVVTNRAKSYGASAFLHRSVLDRIARMFGRIVYLLPSSLHEVMIVPADPSYDVGELCGVVKEINEECVAENDKLADHCYTLDTHSGMISIAA